MAQDEADKHGILRHPLLIVIVSFALSGLLGAIFGQWLSRRQLDIENARVEQTGRKAAIQNLSKHIYGRRVRAEMVLAAIRRKAQIEDVVLRKRQYDEAYVEWNTNHQANLFLVRDAVNEKQYSYLESVIEFMLVGKIFLPLDKCLTEAYDTYLQKNDATRIIDDCGARNLLQQALVAVMQ